MRLWTLAIALQGAASLARAVSQNDQNAGEALEEAKRELGPGFLYGTAADLYAVATDGERATLERGLGTMRSVHQAMYKTFLKTKPAKPLKAYLFRSKDSYIEYNKKAFGAEPTTPFGFYRSGDRKLVMNIATGYGTLVHEQIHPLIEADFPEVPPWFNEGFASLFEQSYFTRDGTIRGDVNWRLDALQKAISDDRAPSLAAVIESSTGAFYGDSRGLNYATARYLCYYLQSRDLLSRYYRSFRDGSKSDPTGRATLENLLGRNLDAIQPDWRKFVSGLIYR